MTRETLNPLMTAASVVEDYYSRVPNAANHAFPPAMIRLVIALATNEFSRTQYPRMVQLAACMYGSLTPSEREYLGSLNLPVEVTDAAAGATPEWPPVNQPEDFSAPSEETLTAFKTRMVESLRRGIDREASKVIVGGDRMVMTQLSQVMEARAILDGQYEGQEPTAQEFPHVAVYAQILGLPTITAAAHRVRELTTQWGQANAGLELIRVQSTLGIMDAESVEAVIQIHDTALAQTAAIVSQVLAASE